MLCVCEGVTFEETFLINHFNALPSLDRLIKNFDVQAVDGTLRKYTLRRKSSRRFRGVRKSFAFFRVITQKNHFLKMSLMSFCTSLYADKFARWPLVWHFFCFMLQKGRTVFKNMRYNSQYSPQWINLHILKQHLLISSESHC